jgi:hypothetical protein
MQLLDPSSGFHFIMLNTHVSNLSSLAIKLTVGLFEAHDSASASQVTPTALNNKMRLLRLSSHTAPAYSHHGWLPGSDFKSCDMPSQALGHGSSSLRFTLSMRPKPNSLVAKGSVWHSTVIKAIGVSQDIILHTRRHFNSW